ncbi:Putative Signal transduction histidine kinase [Magnetospirillum sp. XM-1]|uniref:PAS domain S-box protein n=1 Tax=Magnetospirillum sp. XM-1 TaxID=1663591 RepID=UPI00073DC996|nr:PAS domain S-box protein [Magnetospirillum sp. XM-1]CUW38720.1 Putative Signal transduction histidine kinase [Magnetospirillum sp. XM-1]
MAVLLFIWSSGVLMAWRDRNDSINDSARLTEALTRVVAERLSGSLRGLDLMLQDVASQSQEKQSPAELLTLMRYRSAGMPEVRNIFVIGADGRVKAATLPSMVGMDLSRRPYFEMAVSGPLRPGLIIAPPAISPITGKQGLVVARPIISPLGTFAGLAAAALNPEFFSEALGGVMSGDVDRAVITNLNGDVLARLPAPGSHVGTSIRSGPLFTRYLPNARSGTFIAPSAFDGLDRLASYQVLEQQPVVASVGITTRAALRRWTGNTMIMGAGGVLFSLLALRTAVQLNRREYERRMAEAALKTSEESYRILVNDQDDLIHRYAPDTTLQTVNRAYARFYGKDPDQLIGTKWIDFLAQEEHPFILSCLQALNHGQPYREDHRRVVRPDGQERWIEWRTTALYDMLGNLTGYQTVGRDVTDAHRAQQAISEREELYSQSFHRNPAIKLLIDPKSGAINDANDSAALFYGYPIEVLKRMRIGDINTASPEEIQRELAAVEHEGRKFLRFHHRLSSGEVRDVEVYTSPLHVGGRAYLSSIVVDVSDRNRFEAELQAKTAELARSNAELEQFAYVASHDLRQPLRMVSSYVTLLERHLGERLDDGAREFIGYAVSGVKRMDALIKGLLEYSRVGRGGESMTPVDLGEIVAASRANLGLDDASEEARVTVELPLPTLPGIPSELVRLFQNLIGNAVKYRHPDRVPEIRIGAHRNGDEWIISVADNGMGIDPEHFERIFGMFQRLHGEGEFEGTGIGLAICRKIVTTHHGRIWVESEYGRGCTFLVALPAAPRNRPGQPAH